MTRLLSFHNPLVKGHYVSHWDCACSYHKVYRRKRAGIPDGNNEAWRRGQPLIPKENCKKSMKTFLRRWVECWPCKWLDHETSLVEWKKTPTYTNITYWIHLNSMSMIDLKDLPACSHCLSVWICQSTEMNDETILFHYILGRLV